MSRLTSLAVTMVVAISAGAGTRAQPSNSHNFSKAEIKQMVRDAHTVQQYRDLAAHFRSRQHTFEQQAQSEKVEWERRSQNVTGPAAKYPRPVDSSKNRYEYFTYEAQQMAFQAEHFESLSAKSQ